VETKYIPIRPEAGHLVHLTKKPENIRSILTEGFIYVFNPTTIHERLFSELGITIPDIERGMISFSELSLDTQSEHTSHMLSKFGQFGIAVDFNWALDNGLRRVAYIPDHGPIYDSLKTLLSKTIPQLDHIKNSTDPRDFNVIQKMLLSDPGVPDIFTDPLYSLVLDLLQWVETERNANEKEFRIRAPFTFGGISEIGKEQQVAMSKALAKHSLVANTLPIGPERVLFVYCPQEYRKEIASSLLDTKFKNTKVRCY